MAHHKNEDLINVLWHTHHMHSTIQAKTGFYLYKEFFSLLREEKAGELRQISALVHVE